MEALKLFRQRKQDAYNHHRPNYPVPQHSNFLSLKNARQDLQNAYNKEMSKHPFQRNSDMLYEMDCQLYR
jgi:hypothetical protein